MKNKIRAVSANKSSHIAQELARPKTRYQKFKTDISEIDKDIFNRRNRVKQYKHAHKFLTKSRLDEPEKIKQQNMNLKGFINELQEQLHMQKSIVEMNKKKTSKYVKQFNREFDKQLYYSGKNPNSYMISGVKQQYQNIKQLYAQKCNQLQMCLKDASITDIQEKNSYIEALQNQNTLLKEKVRSFVEYKHQYNENLYTKGKKRSQVERNYDQNKKQQLDYSLSNEIAELKIQSQTLQGQLKIRKQKSQHQSQVISELNKKITFLEHLIIEKDNNQYKSRLQSKKLLTKINHYEAQINNFITQNLKKQKKNEKVLEQIIQKEIKKYQIQCQIFRKSLYDKNVAIEKLQKQIRYLTTLLSYWKPLDEINREIRKQSVNEDSVKEQKSSYFNHNHNPNQKQHKNSSQLLKSQHQSQNVKDFARMGQAQYEKSNRDRSNTEEGNYLKLKTQANKANSNHNLNMTSLQHKIKKPQSCLIRYNDNAKKVRRISLQQIEEYAQLARYRFIGYNYEFSRLKNMFGLSQEDNTDNIQVISMKQIKQILLQKPFFMHEEGTMAISRFIVEEGSSDFVYLDEDNEIQKIIAISILKNLIGQSKPIDTMQIQTQWHNLKKLYLSNIISALRILAPKGVISNVKLLQLLVGLGIQMTQEFKDWIIGTLVIASSTLNELKYQVLFTT